MFQPKKQTSKQKKRKTDDRESKTGKKRNVQSVNAMRKENTSRAQQVRKDKEKHGAKHNDKKTRQ